MTLVKINRYLNPSDCGSENTILSRIQKYLRREHSDTIAGDAFFFQKNRLSWQMNYFEDLIDKGVYDPKINSHLQWRTAARTGRG